MWILFLLRTMPQRAASARFLATALLVVVIRSTSSTTYGPRSDIGYPAGLIPDCPGVTKNATISPKMLQNLQIIHHKVNNGQVIRKSMPIMIASKTISKDKTIDLKNKKTLVYAIGFLETSIFPHNLAVCNAYAKRGYNVFILETFTLLSYIYPKSVRLTRVIGKKVGEFLVKLDQLGLPAENLELLGQSLGAHVISYAAKHYNAVTGKKPSRLTGLDPAGPCFRALDPDDKLAVSDAHKVDIIHTNIDGFGMAERLGHLDFYVNGGEYQPSDIPRFPCLIICSHVRSIIYWWLAIENPKKFLAIKCDSIQDARFAKCYNNTETNYVGLETSFNKPGIYYLPTNNEFPYYRGKDGLKEANEIYTSVAMSINADDNFVV